MLSKVIVLGINYQKIRDKFNDLMLNLKTLINKLQLLLLHYHKVEVMMVYFNKLNKKQNKEQKSWFIKVQLMQFKPFLKHLIKIMKMIA